MDSFAFLVFEVLNKAMAIICQKKVKNSKLEYMFFFIRRFLLRQKFKQSLLQNFKLIFTIF